MPDDLEVLPDDDDDLLPPPPPPAQATRHGPCETGPGAEHQPEGERAPPTKTIWIWRRSTTTRCCRPRCASPGRQGRLVRGSRPIRSPPASRQAQVSHVAQRSSPPHRSWPTRSTTCWAAALVPNPWWRQPKAAAAASPFRGPRNVWDSPLLLIGGGSLIGLLLLGAVLLFVMRRQTGDQAFDIAEEAYKSGAYSSAINAFDQYLQKYPKHASASTAHVHRGLCEMRAASEGSRDWTKVLATAKTTLDQISPELEFPAAQADLASILPAIAAGLATQARKAIGRTRRAGEGGGGAGRQVRARDAAADGKIA